MRAGKAVYGGQDNGGQLPKREYEQKPQIMVEEVENAGKLAGNKSADVDRVTAEIFKACWNKKCPPHLPNGMDHYGGRF